MMWAGDPVDVARLSARISFYDHLGGDTYSHEHTQLHRGGQPLLCLGDRFLPGLQRADTVKGRTDLDPERTETEAHAQATPAEIGNRPAEQSALPFPPCILT